jgi:hypothetical protein
MLCYKGTTPHGAFTVWSERGEFEATASVALAGARPVTLEQVGRARRCGGRGDFIRTDRDRRWLDAPKRLRAAVVVACREAGATPVRVLAAFDAAYAREFGAPPRSKARRPDYWKGRGIRALQVAAAVGGPLVVGLAMAAAWQAPLAEPPTVKVKAPKVKAVEPPPVVTGEAPVVGETPMITTPSLPVDPSPITLPSLDALRDEAERLLALL